MPFSRRFGLSLFLLRTSQTAMIICVVVVLMEAVPWSAFGQRRGRNVQRPKATATPQIDYSKFSHLTNKHQAACTTCHKVPSKSWQKSRDFPDITDYPDHDACVGCHRRQFFKGAAPPICTVCHIKASPREDARFAFRKPQGTRQFTIEFPHDKHQDVIALMRQTIEPQQKLLFLRAAFNASPRLVDEKAAAYNNCTICHASATREPLPPDGGWVDAFVPDTATFKSVPLNHGSCFNCHWKSQAPVKGDCSGCHKLAQPYTAISSPARISMKFRHAREQHVAECTTCHINITKASTLRGLKPDVPITSCTECHNKDGLRLDVASELAQVDKNRDFICVYCHTSNVGRRDAPASHYLIAGREPVKRNAQR